MTGDRFDAVIVGGGFYGARIAVHLKRDRGMQRVCVLEREAALMERASFANQARVHGGYHYPRNFITAQRSRANIQRFAAEYRNAIHLDFLHLYAIARRNSKVSLRQFGRFCASVGAPAAPARPEHSRLFNPQLIEGAMDVQEWAFDARKLRECVCRELQAADVDVRTGHAVYAVEKNGVLRVSGTCGAEDFRIDADRVFVCTYSALDEMRPAAATPVKHEWAEVAMITMPPALAGLGITVMDGPFFSTLPFPSLGFHSLTHVRYTPHLSWTRGAQPKLLATMKSRVDLMLRDAQRYVPLMQQARYATSLFETKTVLVRNEVDDGRPILFESDAERPGFYAVLGGKLDNIYDVLRRIDDELTQTH